MKDFWKDYWELCKESGKFYKKHWKGVVVLTAALTAAELGYFYYQGKKFEKSLMNEIKEDEVQ